MITRIISYQYLLEPEMQQNIQKNKDNGWWTGVWELSVSWFQGTDHDSSVQVIMFSQTHDTSWFTKLPVRTQLLWLGRPAGGIESWAWGPPIDSFKTHDVWCVYVLLFCLVDMVVLMSVWPSGLRRWLQVPFYFGRRGFEPLSGQAKFYIFEKDWFNSIPLLLQPCFAWQSSDPGAAENLACHWPFPVLLDQTEFLASSFPVRKSGGN